MWHNFFQEHLNSCITLLYCFNVLYSFMSHWLWSLHGITMVSWFSRTRLMSAVRTAVTYLDFLWFSFCFVSFIFMEEKKGENQPILQFIFYNYSYSHIYDTYGYKSKTINLLFMTVMSCPVVRYNLATAAEAMHDGIKVIYIWNLKMNSIMVLQSLITISQNYDTDIRDLLLLFFSLMCTLSSSLLPLSILCLHFFHLPFSFYSPSLCLLKCNFAKTWHWQCLSLKLPVHTALSLVEYTSPSTMRSCRGWLHWTPPCPHKAPKSHGHHYSRNSCMSGMTQ